MISAPTHRCDIAVVGGSIIGSAVAYFLRSAPGAPSVTVIEPDPSYEFAAAPRAAGNIRRLWGLPENIAMADFARDFFIAFEQAMAVDGEPAPVDWCPRGYLWLEPPENIPLLERNYRSQQAQGVDSTVLAPSDVARMFPSLDVTGMGAAAWSPGDGWVDGYAAIRGLRRKAKSLGAVYLHDRAVAMDAEGGRVRRVRLASGATVAAAHVVNASGAWTAEVAAMVGMPLPIVPLRRMKFYFEIPTPIEPLPAIRDFPRLTFRPEGKGFFGGVSSLDDAPGFNFEADDDFFQESVWPVLAARIPAFETLKVRHGWAGHYEQNRFDTCAILGPWIGGVENFHVVTGFSGNGIMHGPAAARAVAELLLHDRFTTLDLSRLTWQRVRDGKPLSENIVI